MSKRRDIAERAKIKQLGTEANASDKNWVKGLTPARIKGGNRKKRRQR